jgi:hypothetical protein
MKIVKSIYNFLQEFSRVCAAAKLARGGNHKDAQKLMMDDFKGWI